MTQTENPECNCTGHGRTSGQRQTAGEDLAKVVKAQIPQDYEASFNVRLVPAHSLERDVQVQASCKPRGNSLGWDHGMATIDPGLVATLNKADKVMVAWLAKDTANAQRFLANPVAAIREAGVELTRAEEKALARANDATSAARVVGPGIKVASLSAQAFPNGRIGSIGSGRTDGKTDDFACGPKAKKKG